RHQIDELALFLIRHLETERILEVRHDHARGNLLILQNLCEDREIDPLLRMRWNLNGTHTHTLYRVEHGVKGWRLNDNRVARLADCLQTQVNRFSGTDRNDHFI